MFEYKHDSVIILIVKQPFRKLELISLEPDFYQRYNIFESAWKELAGTGGSPKARLMNNLSVKVSGQYDFDSGFSSWRPDSEVAVDSQILSIFL